MTYLKKYFEEKDLKEEQFEIEHEGQTHFISTEVVKEAILNAPLNEQKQIANTIRKIDFKNGDINDFLKHLAKGLVINS